ncbi:hypothetical protein Trydic_g678 [Trypoxylus dichotomus]
MDKSQGAPPYTEGVHHPPPSYGVPQPQSSTVTQVVVGAQPANFGPQQQALNCPHCRQQIVTRTETKASTKTHIIALILCLCGCWLCCCIPYCVDSCQNKNHYCPHCSAYLGTYQS